MRDTVSNAEHVGMTTAAYHLNYSNYLIEVNPTIPSLSSPLAQSPHAVRKWLSRLEEPPRNRRQPHKQSPQPSFTKPLKSIMIHHCNHCDDLNFNNNAGGDDKVNANKPTASKAGVKESKKIAAATDCLLPSCSKDEIGAEKHVKFADNCGLALSVVHELSEVSELSSRLSDVTLNAATHGEFADVTDEPPLILNFRQPASDYLHFRDLLERHFISLENVILKDYSVLGTIKVKNLPQEKSVFVRLTYDSWETFVDASACVASCVPTYQSTSSNPYETFTFEISIPPDMNINKRIEFAVCLRARNKEYWDNNNGKNYQIISSEWKFRQERLRGIDSVSEMTDCESWTNFATWENVDTTMPYW